jgi:hypothetical protein
MSTTAHHSTPKRSCLDLDDPFGFRRPLPPVHRHVLDDGDPSRPLALAPAGQR